MNGGKVVYIGEHTPWPSYVAVTRERGYPESRRYYQRETCSIVKTWSDSDYDEDWRYRCSECGAFIGVYERDPETGRPVDHDNYCPNCGREVVDG